MTTQRKTDAPTVAVVPAGGDIWGALATATLAAAKAKPRKVTSLTKPTEIGQGIVATMQGTMLLLAIETGPEARGNADVTKNGASLILGKMGNFGRTEPIPGTDLALAFYLGAAIPKAGK